MVCPANQKAEHMKNPSVISAFIYISISLTASGVFFTLTLFGDHTWVTRIGGAVWIFLLVMIVLMPTIIPIIKKRLGNN